MGIRILIVDTSTLIIRRLGELVSSSPEIDAVDMAISCSDAARKLRERKPDVVLLDLGMFFSNFIRLLKDIKKNYPDIFVIVVSDSPDERIRSQCEQAGADYFLDKYNEFEKIPDTIRSIASGS
jgi:DNA-binding NarL/FixJ family response regulator